MWLFVAVFIVAFAYAYSRTPTAQSPTLGTVEAPTAEEGRPIPVLFGTRWLAQPNVVWYGDVTAEPVTLTTGKK